MLYNTILLQAAQGADYNGLIMIVVLIAIFYFFMIRPQNKRQKKIRDERERLEKGDKVVTAGGIYGRVKEKRDTTFVIEIADGVKITVDKNSVYAAADSDAANQDMQAKTNN